MKKILLSTVLALAFVFTSQAQLVPNGDFESPIVSGQLPKWAVVAGSILQTTSVTVNGKALVSASGPRFVVMQNTSTSVTAMQTFKFPLSTRPASLRFLTCYLPGVPASERFAFLILMTKKNGTAIDTVMNATFTSPAGTIYPWANMAVDLAASYKTGVTPDSAIILFVTNAGTGSTSTALLLDDVKFSPYTSGISGIQNLFAQDLMVTPNPAAMNSTININYQLNSTSDVMVDLYDMQGRLVKSLPKETVNYGVYNQSMDIEGLAAGMYICKVTANNQVQTSKIVIQ